MTECYRTSTCDYPEDACSCHDIEEEKRPLCRYPVTECICAETPNGSPNGSILNADAPQGVLPSSKEEE